ncbi:MULTISPECIES: hypothetical protein [Arenibacter]|uniref:hypothetical protein n=1 Tax=Arenibacter TaxID=178469 RepID=UPI000A3C7AFD|nr:MULTISPECIES: hypothetical protein [Arenibacter]
MKRIILLAITILSVSCNTDDDIYPQIENITSGKKWNLQIGSSKTEVYSQLQELGMEKSFDGVSMVYRQPFSTPDDIQSDLSLYRAISIETNSGVIERTLIQFDGNKVISIEKGGAHLETISKWPEDTPNESSILIDDPVNRILQKLAAIYQIPAYQNFQIVLSDKWLEKPYDTDMNNYDEWAFAFSKDISSGKSGLSAVRLYFDNGNLVKIRHEYNETDIVN